MNFTDSILTRLERRVSKLQKTSFTFFHHSLIEFWNFIGNEPALLGILDDLRKRHSELQEVAINIAKRSSLGQIYFQLEQNAALACFVFDYLITLEPSASSPEVAIGSHYQYKQSNEESLGVFKAIFLTPLTIYLEESLNNNRFILSVLTRYQMKCELFNKARLMSAVTNESKSGEEILHTHLLEYLFDHNIEAYREVRAYSGIPDVVVGLSSNDPSIIEAKIFNPEQNKGKSYVINAANQIYTYLVEHERNFGYVVIYKTTEKKLKFETSATNGAISFVTFNGKTIFFIVVDLFDYPQSASKRGPLQHYSITESELIQALDSTTQELDENESREEVSN